MAILTAGTVVSQAVLVIAGVVVARIYTQHDVGIFGVFTSLAGIVGSVACLRYDAAIMLPEDERDAFDLVRACVVMAAATSALASVLLVGWGGPLADALHVESLRSWLWLVGPSAGLVGLVLILQSWSSRQRRFLLVALGRVCQVVATAGVQVGAVVFAAAGLVGGFVAGLMVNVAVLGAAIARRPKAPSRPSRTRSLLVHHWRFPVFSAPGLLLVLFGTEGLPIMFSALFSPATAGSAWLTHRTLTLPVSLIGQSTSTVFYQRISQASPGPATSALIASVFVGLFLLGLAPMIVLVLFAPALFGLVFGSTWSEAGSFAQVLAPRYLTVLAAFPLTTVGLVYKKQSQVAAWQAASVIVPGAALLTAGPMGPVGAMAAYSIASVVVYVGLLFLALRWVGTAWIDVPAVLLDGLRGVLRRAIR